MYRVFCDNCGHYNYSASRIGKWVCSHCGKEISVVNNGVSKTDTSNSKKLA